MLTPISRAAFFSAYRATFGKLKQSQVDGLNQILDRMAADADLTDIRWASYMLATVKHETDDTFHPIYEKGPRSYFAKYEPGTKKGKELGNAVPGDGYRRRGRGLVQTTGYDNDARLTRELGLTGEDNLIEHPEAALRPEIAYRIMSHGMRRGRFTGKRLADYIFGEECDYRGARRIINGLDRADLVASYAGDFEKILKGAAVSAQEVDRG